MAVAAPPLAAPYVFPTPERVAALDRLGDEIAELAAHLEAATARLLDLIRAFDNAGGWNTGFRSCAHWLSWRIGLDLGAAREKVRVARALETLPLLREALTRGTLSYAKVRALTRVATPATEARLLAVGQAGTAAHVERIVRGWRFVDRQAEAQETARRHRSRGLTLSHDDDGMVILRGRLEPEMGALLYRALEAARAQLYPKLFVAATDARARADTEAAPSDAARTALGEFAVPVDPALDPPTLGQQQADALALLAETALHHAFDPGAPGERYQVVVHVDAAVLADPDQPSASAGPTAARSLPSRRPPRSPPTPVTALRAFHHARGLRLDAHTTCPLWQGERLDVGWAIDVLHPLANPGPALTQAVTTQ